MPTDPEYLRRHYASLSDEALLEIDHSELVETAQKCYDEEMNRRKLPSQRSSLPETASAADKPTWLDEASEVFSQVDRAGMATDARDALEAAGVLCFLDLSELPPEEPVSPKPTRLWRLLVPGNLNQRAASILERAISILSSKLSGSPIWRCCRMKKCTRWTRKSLSADYLTEWSESPESLTKKSPVADRPQKHLGSV